MRVAWVMAVLGCGTSLACIDESHSLGGDPAQGGTEQQGGTTGTSGSSSGGLGGSGAQTSAGAGTGATSGTGGSAGAPVTYDDNPRPEDCEVPTLWEDATTRDGELAFDPIEIYEGYVVSPRLPLPSDDDVVTLFVESRTDTAISGAIVLGSGDLPAPATDPLRVYFPAEKYEPRYPGSSWDNLGPARVWSGYALSLREGTVDGARVRFTVNASEQWRTWCELLAGYPNGMCVPSDDADGFGAGGRCDDVGSCPERCDVWSCPERCDIDSVRYDCGKFALCTGALFSSEEAVCSCEGCGCTASVTAGQVTFELRLQDNGELNGSVTASGEEAHDIYLTPQE